MAYAGYLIKVGTYKIPLDAIVEKSYKVVKGVQDLDSYRDSNGVLHRNALSHAVYTTEFQLRQMTNTQFDVIMDNIRSQFTSATERKASVDSYILETGQYTGPIDCYMPDIDITIQQIINSSVIKYEPITLKFISY